ncbi:MAG: MEDS domain-containing protein [Sporichthyaceae bacterium]
MSTATVDIDGLPAAAGDHVCVFYRGAEQRRRTLAAFLTEGAGAGEDCLAIASAQDRAWLRETLSATNTLRLESFQNSYLRAGGFDRDRMLGFWQEWLDSRAQRPGAGGRTVSDMSWAENLFATDALADFMTYEAEATRFAREAEVVALCLYDIDRLAGDVIISALRAHPKMLFNGVLLENPYCTEPA